MPKQAKELSALEVGRLRRAGFNPVGGVPGLGLQIAWPARSWILRFSFENRRPEMGLGGFPEIGLADARNAAKEARSQARAGINPIDAAKASKSAAAAKRAASKTFSDCAAAFIKAKSPEWSNPKHAAQWTSTLEAYAFPVIGKMPVQDVDTPHVVQVLEPIWQTKTETATRVRGRIEKILDWATTAKLREGLNPARWRAHLEVLLPNPTKVSKVKHHASVPYDQVPAFMARLQAAEGQGARALEFAILTAARSGEVRGATWAEIDLANRLWTVPAERMKAGKQHRVPLSPAAIRLLEQQARDAGVDLVFPGTTGKQLSDMTLTACMRRMELDAVPHGFRSSFRTWAGEATTFAREIVEAALAHQLTDAVEAAYMRGDQVEKRGRLMRAWGEYCMRAPASATVTPIRKERAAR